MKIQFLETSQLGLRWMVQYYRGNPQLNRAKAFQSLEATKQRICTLSPPRETFENFDEVWEATILHTAFSILYTIRRDTVYVIDIRDQRGNRSAEALGRFHRELRHQIDGRS
jgi:hypothetical protein